MPRRGNRSLLIGEWELLKSWYIWIQILMVAHLFARSIQLFFAMHHTTHYVLSSGSSFSMPPSSFINTVANACFGLKRSAFYEKRLHSVSCISFLFLLSMWKTPKFTHESNEHFIRFKTVDATEKKNSQKSITNETKIWMSHFSLEELIKCLLLSYAEIIPPIAHFTLKYSASSHTPEALWMIKISSYDCDCYLLTGVRLVNETDIDIALIHCPFPWTTIATGEKYLLS